MRPRCSNKHIYIHQYVRIVIYGTSLLTMRTHVAANSNACQLRLVFKNYGINSRLCPNRFARREQRLTRVSSESCPKTAQLSKQIRVKQHLVFAGTIIAGLVMGQVAPRHARAQSEPTATASVTLMPQVPGTGAVLKYKLMQVRFMSILVKLPPDMFVTPCVLHGPVLTLCITRST